MNWETISQQPQLTEDFLREHADRLDWISICSSKKLSLDFMKEMIEYIFLDVLQYRLQKGMLPHIDQDSLAELETAYLSYWGKGINVLRYTILHSNERRYDNPNPVRKIQIHFQLTKNFTSDCKSYLDLSITLDIKPSLFPSEWSMQGFSLTENTFKWNIPFSTFFATRQQEEAFFHLINQYLIQKKLIQEPISFIYNV